MERIPDDMLFYYSTTDGSIHYFSVHYSTKRKETNIVEIEEEDLWSLVNEGKLQLQDIAPLDFPHPIPGNISGNVKAFII